jgi:hypothetical protein
MNSSAPKTFLICHGAWSAGWAWKKMHPLMAAGGHRLVTPTYTGLGERVHLAHPGIDLDAHIEDMLNVIKYEDLRDTVLVVMCPDLARDGGHIGVGVSHGDAEPGPVTSPSRWACHRRPIAALDHVHDGPSDRRARSKPPALTPGHSGQPGRSAQAGQIQHTSHSLHRQVRWDDPVQLVQGWLPSRMFLFSRTCPVGQ